MPEISRFYGLIITMNFNEHDPPHIHVEYTGKNAVFDINKNMLIEGILPPRGVKMIKKWIDIFQDELLNMWKTKDIYQLPPLE